MITTAPQRQQGARVVHAIVGWTAPLASGRYSSALPGAQTSSLVRGGRIPDFEQRRLLPMSLPRSRSVQCAGRRAASAAATAELLVTGDRSSSSADSCAGMLLCNSHHRHATHACMPHACSSREHQAKHWGAGHKSLCKKLALGIAAGLHARGVANDSAAAEEGMSAGQREATPHHGCSLVPSR